MSLPETLTTPVLLLAMPQVMDPYFHRSVILLVRHEDEGSLGFIVNRPTKHRLVDILDDLEVAWGPSDEDVCAYLGGPVSWEMGTLVIREEDLPGDFPGDEGLDGVAVTQSVADLERLNDLPSSSFRLYLGYAGWGEGQLEAELLRNDWLIAPVSRDLIFNADPESVWRSALESMGVSPEQLPASIQDDHGYN